MSDTPRTEAEEFDAYDSPGSGKSACIPNVVEGKFARQLERELIQALKDKYDAEFALSTTRQQLIAAQVEVKRLRDAIADYVKANNASWLEISNAAIAAGTSTVVLTDKQAAALNQYCALRDAIATPPDLSALSLHDQEQQCLGAKYILGKVLAFMPAGYFATALIREILAELDQAPQAEGEKL